MIELLDYILDYNDNFWIIDKITEDGYYGYMVYKKDNNGNRYNNYTKCNYTKQIFKKEFKIPKYKEIFKPRECFKNHLNEIPLIWRKYVEAMQKIGIDDIGIFGSFLIGFDPTKDVDFVIYGIENYNKYFNNIEYIRKYIGATSITEEHINLQYNKHKDIYNSKCDLKKIISRNWSGVELNNGVLSTPRFISKDYIIPPKEGIDTVRKLIIIDDTYTDFLPRRAKAILDNEVFDIITPLWKFQSFARKNDKVEIYGNYNFKKHVIILDEMKYYIKYL